jgi:hypothetical protein
MDIRKTITRSGIILLQRIIAAIPGLAYLDPNGAAYTDPNGDSYTAPS